MSLRYTYSVCYDICYVIHNTLRYTYSVYMLCACHCICINSLYFSCCGWAATQSPELSHGGALPGGGPVQPAQWGQEEEAAHVPLLQGLRHGRWEEREGEGRRGRGRGGRGGRGGESTHVHRLWNVCQCVCGGRRTTRKCEGTLYMVYMPVQQAKYVIMTVH